MPQLGRNLATIMLTACWICFSVLSFHFNTVRCASTDSFYFIQSPQNHDVKEGQPLRLDCAVRPNDSIHYSWLQNGTRINPEKQSGRRYLEGDSNLRILHADRDLDPGRYQCQALNKTSKFVSASREATINVYWLEPEIHVQLIRPNHMENLRLGEEAELSCVVRAHPPTTATNILWFHNGNARLPNMQTLPNGNLFISALGMQHVGTFHCRVIHTAGKVDSRPPFVIQMTVDEPMTVNTTTLSNKSFLKFALLDRSLQLTCPRPVPSPQKAASESPVIAVWGFMKRLGEQQLSISSLPAVRMQDQDWTLIIDRFEHIHINFYTCEINIPATSERYFYVFQVYLAELYTPKPSNFAPRPLRSQPLAVRLNERLDLRYYPDLTPSQCYTSENISNPPPRIEWFRLSIGHQEPSKIVSLSNEQEEFNAARIYVKNGRHLVIKDAKEDDSGPYEMVLSSIAGRVAVPFQIMVSFPPEFDPVQKSQTLDEGEDLTLSCHLRRRAIPGSRVYWEKDGLPLVNYGNEILAENDGETLRLPSATVNHQGAYQCFVLTDGYAKMFAGQIQNIGIRARLQFVREIKEHFLEVNVQGKLACKVRGYGSLNVDWFRKTPNGLEPIKQPNQVDNGVLIFQYVQTQDAGEYVCVARSDYRNEEIRMNVKVVVGETPRISEISPNQTIQEGDRLLLNCEASGDPRPQINWIVKKPNIRDPFIYSSLISGQPNTEKILEDIFDARKAEQGDNNGVLFNTDHPDDRVQVLSNGSLIINQVFLTDEAEYICIVGNKHAIHTRQGVHVSVLTAEEYAKLKHGDDSLSPAMIRTIVIVINCAVAYLGLIFGLTAYCSIRYLKNRRQNTQNAKTPEADQLITQVVPSSLTQDHHSALLLNEVMMAGGSRAITGSPNGTSVTNSGVLPNFNRHNIDTAMGYPWVHHSATTDAPTPPARQPFLGNEYAPSEMSRVLKHVGGSSGVVATKTDPCELKLTTAPPPTPLDSRSHFSGLASSSNSVSAHSHSLISGTSNHSTDGPNSGGGYPMPGVAPLTRTVGLPNQYHPSDMMGYAYQK